MKKMLSLSILLGLAVVSGGSVFAEPNTSSASQYGAMPHTSGTTTNNGAPWIPGTNSTTYSRDTANLNPMGDYTGASSPSPSAESGAYHVRGTDNVRDNFPGTDPGFNLRNSPNNPRTNYPGDYWDGVRSYGTGTDGVRTYATPDTTGTRTGWGWLGLLGLLGLAGRRGKSRTD